MNKKDTLVTQEIARVLDICARNLRQRPDIYVFVFAFFFFFCLFRAIPSAHEVLRPGIEFGL